MKLIPLTFLTVFLLLFTNKNIFSQQVVSELYTDYNGFWASSNTLVIPDNSHNLLGFKVGVDVYATGVNDNTLTTNGITFNPQEIVSLPAMSNATISNQYFGVGYEYGGTGNVSPVPIQNDPGKYLTDGVSGLDLGTAIFNSSGKITYKMDSIQSAAIGDGIPDMFITQVGSPSGAPDKFKFIDQFGNTVGVEKDVVFGSVPSIGIAKWKFYDKNLNYVSGLAGTRELRAIVFDFSDFGITATNYTDIVAFVHTLSGTSDQPFVAYNKKSISGLPVEMIDFSAENNNRNVLLKWETASEKNNDFFTIEKTTDGKNWGLVTTTKGTGTSTTKHSYIAYDERPYNGISYYRISQTDFDGKVNKYPKVVSVSFNTTVLGHVFPNPTKFFLTISDNSINSISQNQYVITYKT